MPLRNQADDRRGETSAGFRDSIPAANDRSSPSIATSAFRDPPSGKPCPGRSRRSFTGSKTLERPKSDAISHATTSEEQRRCHLQVIGTIERDLRGPHEFREEPRTRTGLRASLGVWTGRGSSRRKGRPDARWTGSPEELPARRPWASIKMQKPAAAIGILELEGASIRRRSPNSPPKGAFCLGRAPGNVPRSVPAPRCNRQP